MENAAVYFCNSQNELDGWIEDLKENPDFIELGTYESVQDLYEELNNQGFKDEKLNQTSLARYGQCLEIANYELEYVAFIGQR